MAKGPKKSTQIDQKAIILRISGVPGKSGQRRVPNSRVRVYIQNLWQDGSLCTLGDSSVVSSELNSLTLSSKS